MLEEARTSSVLTDLDFPRFFTTQDKNAVFPMSADTF